MAAEKYFLRLIFFTVLFLAAPLLQAQTEGSPDTNAESQFVRRLSWNKDDYALRYEVIIEKEENGEYVVFLREFTADFSMEVFFPQGHYRCRVIPYDYLEKPGEGSPWMSFEVRSVVDPKLPPSDKIEIVTDHSEPAAQDKDQKPKLFDFYLGAAWMPLIPLYGENNQFFIRSISLSGAALRLDAILAKENFINIGMELAGSWYASRAIHNGNEDTVQAITVDLNILARKWFPAGKTALTFRLGAGYTFLPGNEEIIAPLTFKESIHLTLGVSFMWQITKHIYMETGLDNTHLFTEDPSGCFRPWIGIGWRL